ncbi:hypothetical protein DNG35_06255 [Mesonia sp. K7]|nr:hypothetical protein DNG35_06255 [Mesonia sp. K7]
MVEKQLLVGNYDQAIELSVNKLQKGKNKKSALPYIALLEDAFEKYTHQQERKIELLSLENNTENSEKIYREYRRMIEIQNQIYPLLPLIKANGEEANFYFTNYNEKLVEAKNKHIDELLKSASVEMQKGHKDNYRKAYEIYEEIEKLNPSQEKLFQLKEEAHQKGTYFIYVELTNNTEQIIPQSLESELTNFKTFELDNFWTVYSNVQDSNTVYDYAIYLDFTTIEVSPEQIREVQKELSREVVTGTTYKKDREGNFVRDENGDKIKIDKTETLSGTLSETIQSKQIFVGGIVAYEDLRQQKIIERYPLETTFIFENVYGTFRGDKKVLNDEERKTLGGAQIPFPTSEKMLVDASSLLKENLKNIILAHPIVEDINTDN